jgi:hypothetical protein
MKCQRCGNTMNFVETVQEKRGSSDKFKCACGVIQFKSLRYMATDVPMKVTVRSLVARATLEGV